MNSNPNKSIARLEKRFMKKRRMKIYTALEELDFHWDEQEVSTFIELWNNGFSLNEIAQRFSRDIDEAAILLMDLGRKKRINPRHYGIERRKVNYR
ncbi:helix-turn-helix domain-containing protein [Anaerobacillus sp. MEB173]|uniref:helix-turn-helix domain-containing protein n=1 Tax=Anaerobacillus sp. MEB173 TaxID=3383345 RepID=UPI003F936CB9